MKEVVMRQGAEGNTLASNVGEDTMSKGNFIDSKVNRWASFVNAMHSCLKGAECTDDDIRKEMLGSVSKPTYGNPIQPFENALIRLKNLATEVHNRGNKVIFIGNGGSAAICSHMAVDWTKNGGIRSIALNDAPTLTCLSNDFGYEEVFAKQLEYYGREGDLAIIISSSGKSPNILAAAKWVNDSRIMQCVTFTGMHPRNALRRKGVLNFYVPVMDYGFTELTHACLLHSIVTVRW